MTSGRRPPHVVVVPYPLIGQVNPMLPLSKLLHAKGFFITFVNTETSRRQALRSGGLAALQGSRRFRFETIPDGYQVEGAPEDDENDGRPLDLGRLYFCIKRSCGASLAKLLRSFDAGGGDVPPVTCVVSSFLATFANDAAQELGIPVYTFWTTSAASLLAALYLPELVQRGHVPLKDESYLTNGYLDTRIDWIPGMKDIRLRDLSSFIRTTNPDELYLHEEISELNYALKASGVILNTFHHLESHVLDVLNLSFSRIYSIGPLPSMIQTIEAEDEFVLVLQEEEDQDRTRSLRLNLRKEDRSCMEWLDAQEEASVVYVSFGSLATLTVEQLMEFAWGLADSHHPFLWIVRTDLLAAGGGRAALPEGFVGEIEGRGFLADWCPQEEVLSHPAVGGFLMHAGWNSMMESIAVGVPMICWPGFADQYTNCHYACKGWGVALEMDGEVRREKVKDRIKEMMEGEEAEEMRRNARKWKAMAEKAIRSPDGTSNRDLQRLAKDLSYEAIDIARDLLSPNL